MSLIKNIKKAIVSNLFVSNYKKFKDSNKLHFFDDKFYSQLEGKYFDGLPVYYYLKYMNVGQCYDCSIILGMALGNKAYICRGDVESMYGFWDEKTGHGWVELDNKVFDTSGAFYCDKETYYKLMKPKNVSKSLPQDYEKNFKEIGDINIHDKSYYEKEYSTNTVLIRLVRAQTILQLETLKGKEREEYEKLLKDLPDISKIPPLDFSNIELENEK